VGGYLSELQKQLNDSMVSVIMPAFNSEGFIETAIKSVLSQTYNNLELIIYDDASGDNTIKTAIDAAGSDRRVKIIKGTVNGGVANARNKAIDMASGRYVAFLDSDDIWKPNKLNIQIQFMKKHECALSYTSYGYINEFGKPHSDKLAPIKENADYKLLLKDNFIGMLTVVIDREKTGEIAFSSDRHEDLILWLSFAKKGHSMKGLNQSLALYRVSGESLSGNKFKAALWRWRIYRQIEKLNILQSLWYMTFYMTNSILKRI